MDGFATYIQSIWLSISRRKTCYSVLRLRKTIFTRIQDRINKDELILKYFGNLHCLRKRWSCYFNKLKDEVIQKHMIGLIIYGVNKIKR